MALLLNTKLIVRRRLEAGLSRAALAQRLGITDLALRRLEEGRHHGERTLAFVVLLAEQLGLAPSALLALDGAAESSQSEDPSADADSADALAALEAALLATGRMTHRDDLAATFMVSPAEISRRLKKLEARLATTGLTIRHGAWGFVKLVDRADLLSEAQHERLERADTTRRGLQLRPARVLAQILSGDVDAAWHRSANRDDRTGLNTLLKQGLVEQHDSMVRPTPRLLYDLGLEDEEDLAVRELFGAYRSSTWVRRRRPSRA